MIISVDVTTGAVHVDEPDDLTAFHAVSSTGDEGLVGAAMGHAGSAAHAHHVWVDAAWVQATVAGVVDADWPDAFAGMLGYASSKGWLNDAGTHILAHIEVGAVS